MAVIGGDIIAFSIDGREFQMPAGTAAKLKLGGQMNSFNVSGGGVGYITQETVSGMVSGLEALTDHDPEDLRFLQDTANDGQLHDLSVTLVDGRVFSGSGTITGDIEYDTQKAKTPVDLSASTWRQQN